MSPCCKDGSVTADQLAGRHRPHRPRAADGRPRSAATCFRPTSPTPAPTWCSRRKASARRPIGRRRSRAPSRRDPRHRRPASARARRSRCLAFMAVCPRERGEVARWPPTASSVRRRSPTWSRPSHGRGLYSGGPQEAKACCCRTRSTSTCCCRCSPRSRPAAARRAGRNRPPPGTGAAASASAATATGRSRLSPAATSRRWRSPSGCRWRRRSCSSTIRPAASTSRPSARSTWRFRRWRPRARRSSCSAPTRPSWSTCATASWSSRGGGRRHAAAQRGVGGGDRRRGDRRRKRKSAEGAPA